jgi:hypothetical protein
MALKKIELDAVNWISLAQGTEPSGFNTGVEVLELPSF